MRVPLRWLGEYVDLPDIPVEELAERLTLAGLEVEGISDYGPLEGVVVGRIASVSPHPNAQRLRVCEVEADGKGYTVVSGAPNLLEGALVPFAIPGARLPDGQTVEAVNLRGVKSQGMILSRQDLCLEEKSTGIWILPPDAAEADLAGELEFPDTVLTLKITSNRPDLLGVYGIAREIGAIFRVPLRELDLSFPEDREAVPVEVTLEDPRDCPRYIARVILGVRNGESPLRLGARISKAGMRPLGFIVDITNYVMLEVGQPLHAFDLVKIPSRRIHVRRARSGERLLTLDGVERALSPEVLLITDGERPIALAGVMGGAETEVDEGTTAVLLEAATFAPARIRRGSRALGLRTEASLRFERHLSPELADIGSRRACHLFSSLGSCRIAKGAADVYPDPVVPRAIHLRLRRVREVLGVEVPEGEIEDGLSRLGIALEREDRGYRATVPTIRVDLLREIDLIEEVARLYGYERIPSSAPVVPLRRGSKDPREAFADEVRSLCAALGLQEAVTPGLVPAAEAAVRLRNPMVAGQEGLRASLRHGLVEVVRENFAAQAEGVAIFEVGRVFLPGEDGVVEEDRLGIALAGRTPVPLSGKETYDLLHLKGILESLFAALGVGLEIGEADDPWLHPYRRAGIFVGGKRIGWLGELLPEATGEIPGAPRVLMAELSLVPLRGARCPKSYRPLPRYPASKRDLSLLAPDSVPEGRIREAILEEGLVEKAFLYDLYRGPGMPEGHRSLTYELTFRHPEHTLSSEEVEEAVRRILRRLETLNVRLRG